MLRSTVRTLLSTTWRKWRLLAAVVLYLVPGLRTGLAQAPTTLLEMQIQNVVSYWDDVADPSKLASSPNIAAPAKYQQSVRAGARICCSRDAGSVGSQDTELPSFISQCPNFGRSCPYPIFMGSIGFSSSFDVLYGLNLAKGDFAAK